MAEQDEQSAQLSVERIYIKDVSYEAPAVPLVFTQQLTPELNIQVGITHATLNESHGIHEVVLAVSVTATHGDKTVFLVEIQQAGLFRILGLRGELLEKTLQIACSAILLPFAREAVNDFVSKGGFPQLLITPINFEALYEQRHADAERQAQA